MKSWFEFTHAIARHVFHKRSIIIISKHKTNHMALSGPLQFSIVLAITACISLASYSTGSYMSARSVMEKQEQTLESVASSRIGSSFSLTMAATPHGTMPQGFNTSLADPSYSLPTMNREKLFARIAMLEERVKSLRTTNAEIIQTVREKTHNQLASMETLIRATGLNPDTLKEAATHQRKDHAQNNTDTANNITSFGGEGGPYIAAETPDISSFNNELSYKMDQFALLSKIVSSLPLGKPLKIGSMESNFGRRIDPFNGHIAFHPGIDMSGPTGSEIMAAGTGRVVTAGWNGAYGNCVDIDHGFGIVTRYGHMSTVKVSVGDIVQTGQLIGIQGSTGRSTGPHVHYEVRYYNTPLDPTHFLHAGYHVSQASE